jgi:hypothetical protein
MANQAASHQGLPPPPRAVLVSYKPPRFLPSLLPAASLASLLPAAAPAGAQTAIWTVAPGSNISTAICAPGTIGAPLDGFVIRLQGNAVDAGSSITLPTGSAGLTLEGAAGGRVYPQ